MAEEKGCGPATLSGHSSRRKEFWGAERKRDLPHITKGGRCSPGPLSPSPRGPTSPDSSRKGTAALAGLELLPLPLGAAPQNCRLCLSCTCSPLYPLLFGGLSPRSPVVHDTWSSGHVGSRAGRGCVDVPGALGRQRVQRAGKDWGAQAVLSYVMWRLELPRCPLAKGAEHLTFRQPSLQTRSRLHSEGCE